MAEEWSLSHQKIACGQYHSAFIGLTDTEQASDSSNINKLYVWGNNEEGQLSNYIPKGTSKFQKKLDRPEVVPLMFGQRQYEAISVQAGPSYNLIIGQVNLDYERGSKSQGGRKKNKQKFHLKQPLIMPGDEKRFKEYRVQTRQIVEQIRELLKKILLRKGTLLSLFQNSDNDDKKGKGGVRQKDVDILKGQQQKKRQGGYSQFYQEDRNAKTFKPQTAEDGQELDDFEIDPAHFIIERQEFIDKLTEREVTHVDNIHNVAEVIYENNGDISLQQLEDFALGFQQDAIKLFMYGKCDAKLFSFDKKLPIVNPKGKKKLKNDDSSSSDAEELDNQEVKISIITRPTVITFPKFCPQIVQVSCGVGHILALTSHFDMYSWGNGEYGALGFGSIQSVTQPTPLNLKQNGVKLQIAKVECGSLHSMCVTQKKQLFTWGCGKQGRLGLGNEEDVLHPTEVVALSNMRVCQVSAGESHCAAITQAGKVYVWGNGSYGRLGTGFESQENTPQLVEDLSNRSIVRVSCGAFHTFVLSDNGTLYAFGQNKYGKLGLNVRKENTVFRSTHIKIMPYNIQFNQGKKIKIEEDHSTTYRQVIAGYNHSMAVMSNGSVYTWGYSGFGILGRDGVENIPIAIMSDTRHDKTRYFIKVLKSVLALPQEDHLKNNKQHQQSKNSLQKLATRVTQVQCVSLGTLTLTDNGEIHYCGDDRYGQKTIDEEEKGQEVSKQQEEKLFKTIRMPNRIKFIACGGDHLFAIAVDEKVYGWGRNDSAQLGIGLQQDYINVPSEVPAFREEIVVKIVCGPNYSAAITTSANLLVAGSMEHGKLGLGANQRSGFTQEFTKVPRIKSVRDVACGPTHMLAITSQNATSNNSIYAWGNNQSGQLGLDSTDSVFVPKEITALKKSERFDQVAAGFDFSLGISRQSRKVYMWGNAKYYGTNMSANIRIHKTPVLVKDLESYKIKSIFCSETYAFAITENDEVKMWGEWLYDKANDELVAAGLQNNADEEKKGGAAGGQSDGEEQVSDNSSGSYNSSESDEEDEKYYKTEESDEDDNQNNKATNAKKRDQAQEYFPIQSFPAGMSATQITPPKPIEIAFGTNHATAIGQNGLLYTWGMNQVQQLGVDLVTYEKAMANKSHKEMLNQVQEAELNEMLTKNQNRQEEEAYENGNGQADAGNQDDQDSHRGGQDQEQDVPPGEEKQASNQSGGDTDGVSQSSASSDSQSDGDEDGAGASGKTKPSGGKSKIDKGGDPDAQGIIDHGDIQLAERTADGGFVKAKKIEDFPKIPQPKQIRIYGSQETSIEQKMFSLHSALHDEKKKKSDEESLFHLDKQINEALSNLLKTVAKLPEIQRQRRTLKVKIKNAFMQRISEKPLAVPPAVDWNNMKASKYRDRQSRRFFKPQLQQILNILHNHPCYMINMYTKTDLGKDKMLKYLKILYPTQVLTNFQPGAKNPKLDTAIMISREQERVNLNLISFMKKAIEIELRDAKNVKSVSFTSDDSLIGRLFYRVLKSQERNVDTICCMLAHLMNKFIQRLQEGSEFDNGGKQDAARGGGGGAPNSKKTKEDTQFERSEKACLMYESFLKKLIEEILENSVLSGSTTTGHFKPKKDWQPENDKSNSKSIKLQSLRFSSEIALLSEIIQKELHDIRKREYDDNNKKAHANHDEHVASKITSLIFHRMIKKISESEESLKLYLYPYLRETKKQILIDEGMQKQGATYLELCRVINMYFSEGTNPKEYSDNHWQTLDAQLKTLRAEKIQDILQKFKETNTMQPKLLPVKHFESGLYHSMSPYDFQMRLDKKILVDLLKDLFQEKEDIALIRPVNNDQLFRLFGTDPKEKKDQGGAQNNQASYRFETFLSSLQTYNDKFNIKIPSRMYVNTTSTSVQKCKDCEAVLTDDFVKLEGQPIIDQYEPEDKESLVSVYNEILRQVDKLDGDKNIIVQLQDISQKNRAGNQKESLSEKLAEFQSMLDREISSQMDRTKDDILLSSQKGVTEEELITDKYNALKGRMVTDWLNFESSIKIDQVNESEKTTAQLKGLARTHIEEHVLLKQSQDKINERISHKNINQVLQNRMAGDLKDYLDQMIMRIKKDEIFLLKLQLFNSQLGLGNSELKKLTKNSDQVTQMKGILNQQRNQKYSQILYRVLPDGQKMALRAIIQKSAKDLIKNKTITEIKVKSLRPMISSCKLLLMEDEKRDVLVKLLYVQKTSSCLCFNSNVIENLLLQFHLSQVDILNIRKYVQKYQMFEMHVNLAFDQGSYKQQQEVCAFANTMAGNTSEESNKKKKGGDKKTQNKKLPESRESALQALQIYNRKLFKDCIEFDLTKLIGLINDMLRTRYAYIFNSDRTPEQLLNEYQDMV